jgi:hypothetical protein
LNSNKYCNDLLKSSVNSLIDFSLLKVVLVVVESESGVRLEFVLASRLLFNKCNKFFFNSFGLKNEFFLGLFLFRNVLFLGTGKSASLIFICFLSEFICLK